MTSDPVQTAREWAEHLCWCVAITGEVTADVVEILKRLARVEGAEA